VLSLDHSRQLPPSRLRDSAVDLVRATPSSVHHHPRSEALSGLNARREDGEKLRLEGALPTKPVLALSMDGGELKIVPEPAGTRGYDDLPRAATREPLGQAVRPSVASPGDLARMPGALGRDEYLENLRMLRRLIELKRDLHRGRYIER
jgi:hypothetical protein